MFKEVSRFLLLFGMALGLVACASQEQKLTQAGATRLTADQVREHLEGNTEIWTRGGAYYAPDNKLKVKWQGEELDGSYQISDGGKICVNVDGWEQYCQFYMNDNGTVLLILKNGEAHKKEMLEGNQTSQI